MRTQGVFIIYNENKISCNLKVADMAETSTFIHCFNNFQMALDGTDSLKQLAGLGCYLDKIYKNASS